MNPWLLFLAFVLGIALTWVYMVRRATWDVPVLREEAHGSSRVDGAAAARSQGGATAVGATSAGATAAAAAAAVSTTSDSGSASTGFVRRTAAASTPTQSAEWDLPPAAPAGTRMTRDPDDRPFDVEAPVAASKPSATDRAVAFEEPEPAALRPAIKQPAVEQPAVEQPAVEQPAASSPAEPSPDRPDAPVPVAQPAKESAAPSAAPSAAAEPTHTPPGVMVPIDDPEPELPDFQPVPWHGEAPYATEADFEAERRAEFFRAAQGTSPVPPAVSDAAQPATADPAQPTAVDYGPGTIRADRHGYGRPGYEVKGDESGGVYHTQASPGYAQTRADVWFRDEATAIAAGFRRWDEHQ